MPAADRIHLASQSPRRRQLLDQLGVAHDLLLPGDDEDAEALEHVLPGELPADYVQRVTGLKLDAARRRQRRRGGAALPILCADTTVAVGRRILGKPADAAEAAAMLGALSGRTHRVLTAVALASGRRRWTALNTSHVTVAPLSRQAIAAYVASGEPFGKAGAYAIQSQFAGWIVHIDGSHSGIMGLPLYETAELLRQARIRFGQTG
ncbi:nucleoside triphosphate pyrophosphatase [Ideonella sp. A 288]|uniref:Maf family protein n=1 Tax=Ideonella sp. A 288 TaxID=1962181 RepID=UPI000B4C0C4D|nr:Maf family protein [Ideonella sp. A 288]